MNSTRCVSCKSEKVVQNTHDSDWQHCLTCGHVWGLAYFPDFYQTLIKAPCEKLSEVYYLVRKREVVGDNPSPVEAKQELLDLLKEVSDLCLKSIEIIEKD